MATQWSAQVHIGPNNEVRGESNLEYMCRKMEHDEKVHKYRMCKNCTLGQHVDAKHLFEECDNEHMKHERDELNKKLSKTDTDTNAANINVLLK